MDLYISPNLRNGIILAVLSVLFLILVFLGGRAGKKQAQSSLILNWASEQVLALNYFYNDNNRFPSADEFIRPEVMQNYFSAQPLGVNIQSTECPEILKYQRPQTEMYELYFCLPKAQGGYKLGWNQITK